MSGSFRFCVLSSGSKGNALWVEADGRAVLVDCGLSGKEMKKRAAVAGLNLRALEAVIVSHEHRDHASCAGIVARMFKVPLYANEPTLKKAENMLGRVNVRPFPTGKVFSPAGINVRSFSISHDTADPVGFTFETSRAKLGLATDLGVATSLVRERLRDCHALVLESNHDYKMLMDGPYPWDLKQRVRSRMGHLSNEDSAMLLDEIRHPGLKTVVLAHLSEVNNHPDLVMEYFQSQFRPDSNAFSLQVASQYQPGPVISISE